MITVLHLPEHTAYARAIGGDNALYLTQWIPWYLRRVSLLLVFWHGSPSGYAWTDGQQQPIATASDVAALRFIGRPVVFLGSCGATESRMIAALWAAGASWIVAGPGENYLPNPLARVFRSGIEHGLPVRAAWWYARARVRAMPGTAAVDTQAYQLLRREHAAA